MEKIILMGGGGHCKSIIDSIKSKGNFEIVGIIDINNKGKKILGVEILGGNEELPKLYSQGVKNAFICVGSVGDPSVRKRLYNEIKNIGYSFPVISDLTSIISPYATIEDGVFIGKGAIVNANAYIKKQAIINTGVIVDHDCKIGEFVHLAPGSTLSGTVVVGDNSHIGTNSTIIQGIDIGENVLVGAGSVIVKDIEDNSKVCGNPGRKMKA